MHIDEDKVNTATFAKFLKGSAGYTAGMFGKCVHRVHSPVTSCRALAPLFERSHG